VRLDAVRPGFDTRFLGRQIELPVIPGVGDEFPYLHFSVVMNPARRLAWYVAYNAEPPGERIDRPDRWLADPTLSRSFQPTDEHFARTGFDRGHLASPMTVAWGDGRRPGIAVRQSYFWTNTAPQSRRLNQRSWARLEQAERRLAAEHGRLTGFSGPVLDDADPLHVVTDEVRGRLHARRTFRLPRRFWKVAVWEGPGGPVSAAWMADNDAAAAATAVSTERVEELTGLIFPEVVRSATPGSVVV
jgi:endonuclease G